MDMESQKQDLQGWLQPGWEVQEKDTGPDNASVQLGLKNQEILDMWVLVQPGLRALEKLDEGSLAQFGSKVQHIYLLNCLKVLVKLVLNLRV